MFLTVRLHGGDANVEVVAGMISDCREGDGDQIHEGRLRVLGKNHRSARVPRDPVHGAAIKTPGAKKAVKDFKSGKRKAA